MSDDVNKPERYLIRDTKTNTYNNYEGYSTASRARNAADKLDNAYGRAANIDMEGGMKPGQSPSLDNPIMQAKGGKVSASSRGDGIAQRGKTKGRMC